MGIEKGDRERIEKEGIERWRERTESGKRQRFRGDKEREREM